MGDRSRATILITGRVQGVFFRSSTMQEAQRLGLSGFVQNLADGAVEVVVEGDASTIEQLLVWCRVGPPGARVEDVHIRWTPAKDEFRTFSVVR